MIARPVGELVGACSGLRHLRERVVDEGEQRRHRAEAARDRTPRAARRPQRLDVAAGLVQHGDLRVAEAVNRLLSIADDEDGRAGREPEAFTPRLDQQRHQLPLRAAGVLELVHQHVVIPRFETVAALRELVHLAQQVEGALEHVRKIQHRALVERPPILRERDSEHALDAARHDRVEIAGEARHHPFDRGAELRDRLAMPAGRVRRRIVLRLVGMDRAGRARPAVARQEVRRDALDQPTDLGIARLLHRGQPADLAEQQLVPRVADRALLEEARLTARDRPQRVPERRQRPAADHPGGQVGRAALQEPIECAPRHQPAIQQRRQPFTRSRQPELGQHQRDVRLVAGEAREDPQRLIQRLFDQPRHLGFVGHLEARIDVRLERELTQQRQTERVDGADRNLAEAIAQLHPAPAIELRSLGRIAQFRDDALAHLGGGLARERHRQDVRRLDAGAQQVQIARHEHRCLARARRSLEDDVVQGIHGEAACRLVGVGRVRRSRRSGCGFLGDQHRGGRGRHDRVIDRNRCGGRRDGSVRCRVGRRVEE